MTVPASLDLLYFILAIAAVWIGVMLTWLLFEAALFAHRANRTLKDGIDKIKRVEQAILSVKDRLESSFGYFNILAEGSKAVMGFLQDKKKKKSRRGKDDEDDDE